MQISWGQRNEEYLAVALNWLRLQLVAKRDAVEMEKLTREMEEYEDNAQPPSLIWLSEVFGLTLFERSLLLLCAAMEYATDFPQLCGEAQGSEYLSYPTFSLAFQCLPEPTWDVVLPERPLRFWELIEINQSSNQPLTISPLRANERIVNYIKGVHHLAKTKRSPISDPFAQRLRFGVRQCGMNFWAMTN